MAKRFWPDSDPLNDRILIGRGVAQEFDLEPERQIVGVVADTRDGNLQSEPGVKMYVPQAQMPDSTNVFVQEIVPTAWVVRTRGSPLALSLPVQEELRQTTGLPVADARSMEAVVLRSTSRQRFSMWLMSVFAGAALLLAAIGVYGLIAYSVEQRTQEIGVRLALGAGTTQVRRMIVFQGMRLVVIGVIIGVASTTGLTRFVASFLFGVEEWDPLAFTVVPAVLTTVALVAVLLPARRASRVNPIEALRCD